MQNIIKEILMISNISKTQFAKDLGISKSYVVNVINGKKKCSHSMYIKIRNLGYVSQKQRKDLDYAFYCEKYGKKDYELLLFTIDQLNEYDSRFNNTKKVFVRTDFMEALFNSDNTAHIINGKTEFLEIVSYFTEKCLKCENPFFFSNYSFLMTELDDVLFSTFKNRDYSKDIHFEHINTFDNNDSATIVNAFFSSLKWAHILFNTRRNISSNDSIDSIFPYYIILNNAVILFDEHTEKGVVFLSQNLIEYYSKQFSEKCLEFNQSFMIVGDEAECLGQSDCYTNSENLYFTLGGIACLGPFTNYDILNRTAKYIPHKDQLIRLFIAHYGGLFNESRDEYISESSYWDFVENGDLKVITDRYVSCCSLDDRIKILSSIIDKNNNTSSLHIKLLNKNQLRIPSNLGIDCFENSLIITSLFQNEPCTDYVKPYGVIANINYSEYFWLKGLVDNLHSFIEESEFVLSDEATIRAFERMIAKCKGLKNDK